MGAVSFTPLVNKKYRIELKNGKSYPLPEIHSQGMVLNLRGQDKEHLDFCPFTNRRLSTPANLSLGANARNDLLYGERDIKGQS